MGQLGQLGQQLAAPLAALAQPLQQLPQQIMQGLQQSRSGSGTGESGAGESIPSPRPDAGVPEDDDDRERLDRAYEEACGQRAAGRRPPISDAVAMGLSSAAVTKPVPRDR